MEDELFCDGSSVLFEVGEAFFAVDSFVILFCLYPTGEYVVVKDECCFSEC